MIDPLDYKGTYIYFAHFPDEKKKTTVWRLLTKDIAGSPLGTIKWFSPWRKYCFFPAGGCVFEETCLGEIADFIRSKTILHREALKAKKNRLILDS